MSFINSYISVEDVKLPEDPYVLSFHVLRLGIFNTEQINTLLGIESTNQRLRHELDYMKANVSNHGLAVFNL